MSATTPRSLVLLGFLGLLVGAARCATTPRPGTVVYVARRPPPYRREVIGVAPGAGFIWIGGFWRWGGADYVWVPGRWERVPPGRRAWARGRWRHTRRGWFYVEGRWR